MVLSAAVAAKNDSLYFHLSLLVATPVVIAQIPPKKMEIWLLLAIHKNIIIYSFLFHSIILITVDILISLKISKVLI